MTHPQIEIILTDTVKTLKDEGYFIYETGWFFKEFHLGHREFDYPLFSHKNDAHVVAKGLAYCLQKKKPVDNSQNKEQ